MTVGACMPSTPAIGRLRLSEQPPGGAAHATRKQTGGDPWEPASERQPPCLPPHPTTDRPSRANKYHFRFPHTISGAAQRRPIERTEELLKPMLYRNSQTQTIRPALSQLLMDAIKCQRNNCVEWKLRKLPSAVPSNPQHHRMVFTANIILSL